MSKTSVVVLAVSMLAAANSEAERLKGYIWEASPSAIVVDGETVRLAPETVIDRPNHKDITAKDLRIGWEVEVETRGEGTGQVARKVRVKDARFREEDIEGIVDGVNHVRFFVDGDEIRLTKGTVPPGLKPGMRFKGKGIRQDDRSIELKEGQVLPAGFVGEEAQFMAAVDQEIAQVKTQLKTVKDPELQAYVDRVGRSLVPKWVDPQQFRFTFTLVDDPTLNAFAMPDGTVVVHSGLLAALENEAQLAAVLGHEIGHATHRHGYRGFKSQQKKQSLFGLGSALAGLLVGTQTDSAAAGLVTGLGTNLAYQASVNGHGRKLEDEADMLGLYYMVEAGYDYMEAPEVWRVFGKYTKDQSKVSNFFFSDHSTHAARIKNLTKEINAEYRGEVPRGKLRTGEEEYQKAVERLSQQNAMANLQSQEYGRAQRSLAGMLDRNPNDANAHYNLGRVLWAQGGAQNAERVLEEYAAAVQLDPTLAAPWRDIGVVFYELRDVNRAARAFERYLELAPDAPEAPKIRAFLNMVRGQ
ncbi:MAG TPA: tetratricopeptide repeat protein [Vicinamibacteria bacterium]|nr:tetratricopeptide repeat protein [Vicinamibacteria bacterium]